MLNNIVKILSFISKPIIELIINICKFGTKFISFIEKLRNDKKEKQ